MYSLGQICNFILPITSLHSDEKKWYNLPKSSSPTKKKKEKEKRQKEEGVNLEEVPAKWLN